MSQEKDQQIAKQGRMVALVIAGTMLIWILAQVIGPRLGLPGRYALLIDFAAMAAFFWALFVAYQIWRKRQSNEG